MIRWARLRLTFCASSREAIAAIMRVPSVGFCFASSTIAPPWDGPCRGGYRQDDD
jgi:hypothetical protein